MLNAYLKSNINNSEEQKAYFQPNKQILTKFTAVRTVVNRESLTPPQEYDSRFCTLPRVFSVCPGPFLFKKVLTKFAPVQTGVNRESISCFDSCSSTSPNLPKMVFSVLGFFLRGLGFNFQDRIYKNREELNAYNKYRVSYI